MALGAGPTLRSGKEVASLPDTELVFFLSSSLSSPIWLPGSTLDPHPQDQESPVLEEFRTRRVSQRHSNSLGLSKHFLGVSQPWEEILGLCPFYS